MVALLDIDALMLKLAALQTILPRELSVVAMCVGARLPAGADHATVERVVNAEIDAALARADAALVAALILAASSRERIGCQ